MAIKTDARAFEAKYGQGGGQMAPPPKDPELWFPGSGKPPPTGMSQTAIPTGQPVPEGVVISQVVGRGQPAMAVVPPQQHQSNQPAMAVLPPQDTNRTTVGTFVETPRISSTVTNPMTAAPPPVNSGTVEAPVVQELEPTKPKRTKVDLAQEILTHIWELGGEKSEECQKFYDRSEGTLKNWQQQPAKITLDAVQKFLSKRPGVMVQIAEELEPHFVLDGNEFTSLPNRGKRDVMVCSPVLERPTLPWAMLMVYLAKKYELGFEWQADTMITRSRNMLAHRFLKTGVTWSLWVDCDMVVPTANPDWYRSVVRSEVIPEETCQYDALNRLEGSAKAIIGGVYSSRIWHGRLVIQPDIHPRHHEDKLLCNEIRRGTARGLAQVDWIGFGLALVHREVFLEVQRQFPHLAPKNETSPWGFFDTTGDMGEDEAFCQRVKACSIPIWLDTQLIVGHIGSMAFMPEHTAAVAAL
jgi:hypothetical protein